MSSPVQHLLRLGRESHDPGDLVLTDQDPVLLGDVEGADVAFGGVTEALRQIAAEVTDEGRVRSDLTGSGSAVLLRESDHHGVVVGERNAEDGSERQVGGVHVSIVAGWG